jgi:uncharacterized protein DUF3306
VSEPEGFLSRWARLKHEAGEAPEPASTGEPVADAVAPSAPEPAPTFDLSALPSIESITAATDIRAFLAPGVPVELTRAALRRAWVADPVIRDFVGLAENQWDFNDPNAMPGFGPIGSLDDMRRLLARVMGEADDGAEAPEVASAAKESPEVLDGAGSAALASPEVVATTGQIDAARDEPAVSAAQSAECVQCSEAGAVQKDEEDRPASSAPVRRAHGGALPQ